MARNKPLITAIDDMTTNLTGSVSRALGRADIFNVTGAPTNLGIVTTVKQGDGIYTRVYGTGEFIPESIAALLVTESAGVLEQESNYMTLRRTLCDAPLLRDIFIEIFGKMTQMVNPKETVASLDKVQSVVAVSRRDIPEPVTLSYTEVLNHVLGSMELLIPSKGYVYFDIRTHRPALEDDFLLAAAREEVELAFRNLTARVSISASKVTAEVLYTKVRDALKDVADSLAGIHNGVLFMRSALGITHNLLVPSLMPNERPDLSVATSPEMVKLMQNASWVMAAMNTDAVLTPDAWRHMADVRYAARVVGSAPGLQHMAISDYVAPFNVSRITDGRANIHSVLVTKNRKLMFDTKVGWIDGVGIAEDFYQFNPQRNSGAALNALVSPVQGLDLGERAHAAMRSALETIVVEEESIVSTVIHPIGISEREMAIIAIASTQEAGGRVYVAPEYDDEGTFEEWTPNTSMQFLFEVPIGESRFFFEDRPVADIVVTDDIYTAVAVGPERKAWGYRDSSAEIVKTETFKYVISQDVRDLFYRDYSKVDTLEVTVGKQALSLQMSIPSFFREEVYQSPMMFRHVVAESVLSDYMLGLMRCLDYASMHQIDEDEGNRLTLIAKRKAAYMILGTLMPVFKSPAMTSVAETVYNRLVSQTTDRSAREYIRRKIVSSAVKYKIRLWLTLFFMRRAHLITGDARAEVLALFDDLKFFETEITTNFESMM